MTDARVDAMVRAQIAEETAFWETDPHERPGVDALENLLNKAVDATIFHRVVAEFASPFRNSRTIVELGGGQGWASCLVKRLYPEARVILTDAVAAAVSGRGIWERVFRTTLDDAIAAPAQAVPLPDGSVDLLFCYAAAHHFVNHPAALAEASRLLRPGGWCLWLYEPTSSGWLHRLAEARVNRKRPDVKEHVMVPAVVLAQARAAGFDAEVRFWPQTLRQGRFETAYYLIVSSLPALARLLPCTAHFVLRKR